MAMNETATVAPRKMSFSMAINSSGYQKLINATITDPKKRDRFVSAITSAVATNPLLQDCDNATILSAAFLGNSLDLSPSPQLGHYYLVPFNNTKRGVKEAQFQLGYKGYVQLALRSGYYKRLNVFAVKAGELKSWNPVTEELDIKIIEDDEVREKTATVGYVASFEYTNGFTKTLYWSRQKMESHALRYSKGYAAKKGYTFWEKDFDAMAFKTMLRQLISKWGIMSIDLQSAFEQDTVAEEADQYLGTDEMPQIAPVTDIPQEIQEEPEAVEPAPDEVPKTRKKAQPVPSLDDL